MVSIRRILCPVDFSEASTHAVDQAIALAGWYKARVTGLHVSSREFTPVPALRVPEESMLESEMQRVRDQTAACFRGAAAAGVGVDVLVEAGSPAVQILDRARSLPADVIVMGTHGTSGFEHFVLGSVTEKVLRRATCAVLTVPPRARAISTLPFRRLLCPMDFSEPSLAAFQFAWSLAQESGAALVALHVIEWPWEEPPAPLASEMPPEQAAALTEYRRYLETSAMARLEALAPEGHLGRPARTSQLRHGKSYVEILRVAETAGVDLIVIGVRGRNTLDVTLFGSTTNQVIRRATCPVLTLRD